MIWSQHVVSVEEVGSIVRRSPPSEWLSAEELRYYTRFGDKPAALAWLGGRWCAKQVLRVMLGVSESQLSRIHVQSRNAQQQSVRPWVFLDGCMQSANISLAHSPRLSTAVLLGKEAGSIGVDISEPAAGHSSVRDYWFSDKEVAWCEAGIAPRIIWSLKEAIYKAVNQGDPFRPRALDVSVWLSQEECRQIDFSGGTLQGSAQGATIAWRSFCGSLIVVVAMPGPSRSDIPIPSGQVEYVLTP